MKIVCNNKIRNDSNNITYFKYDKKGHYADNFPKLGDNQDIGKNQEILMDDLGLRWLLINDSVINNSQ